MNKGVVKQQVISRFSTSIEKTRTKDKCPKQSLGLQYWRIIKYVCERIILFDFSSTNKKPCSSTLTEPKISTGNSPCVDVVQIILEHRYNVVTFFFHVPRAFFSDLEIYIRSLCFHKLKSLWFLGLLQLIL